jgi:ComF family protein
LATTFLDTWAVEEIDLVVPVPLHPRRKRERGYNQAALLGRELANLLGLSCHESALSRVRATLPQVGLTDTERSQNVRHAFRCIRPASIRGRRILLIDDVMTTGSTVASASSSLLEAGAKRVCVLTLARAVTGVE